MAEGNSAILAALGLFLTLLQGELFFHFLKILCAFFYRAIQVTDPIDFHEITLTHCEIPLIVADEKLAPGFGLFLQGVFIFKGNDFDEESPLVFPVCQQVFGFAAAGEMQVFAQQG